MSPGRRCDRAIALFGTTAALFTEAFQRRVGSSIRRPPLSATVLRTPNTGRPCTAASHLFPCHSHCRPKSEGKSQSAALQRSPHTLCITFLFGDSLSLSLSLSLSVCVCVCLSVPFAGFSLFPCAVGLIPIWSHLFHQIWSSKWKGRRLWHFRRPPPLSSPSVSSFLFLGSFVCLFVCFFSLFVVSFVRGSVLLLLCLGVPFFSLGAAVSRRSRCCGNGSCAAGSRTGSLMIIYGAAFVLMACSDSSHSPATAADTAFDRVAL